MPHRRGIAAGCRSATLGNMPRAEFCKSAAIAAFCVSLFRDPAQHLPGVRTPLPSVFISQMSFCVSVRANAILPSVALAVITDIGRVKCIAVRGPVICSSEQAPSGSIERDSEKTTSRRTMTRLRGPVQQVEIEVEGFGFRSAAMSPCLGKRKTPRLRPIFLSSQPHF